MEARFRRALELLSRLDEIRLVDPANSANVVTDDLEWTRKRAVAEPAARAAGDAWELVVWSGARGIRANSWASAWRVERR